MLGKKILIGLVLAVVGCVCYAAPEVIRLWPEGMPGARQVGAAYAGDDRASSNYEPTLTLYQPEVGHATGTAVIICPGGGYVGLAFDLEGEQYAHALNKLGVTAFVLRYRVRSLNPAPLLDVLRAVRLVRFDAAQYEVNPDRIGVMGSSAGGHLAASAGTLFDNPLGRTGAELDNISARPDFLILVYPVVTMVGQDANVMSRKALLGGNPTEEALNLMSVEKHVTSETPPTLLIHSQRDQVVPVENSILFYQALTRAKVPAEMYLFDRGYHGMGMNPGLGSASEWPKRMSDWLKERGLLEKAKLDNSKTR